MKQVEDVAGQSGAVDLTDLRQAQQDIAERLASLETKTDASPLTGALAAFEARIASVEAAAANTAKVDQIGDTVKIARPRAAAPGRQARTKRNPPPTPRSARSKKPSPRSARASNNGGGAAQETEAVRAHARAASRHHGANGARSRPGARSANARARSGGDEGVEGALADVNRRLAAAERRQAQTIEAISIEIKRMSETVDQRLRTVEARNDDAAASAVREELSTHGDDVGSSASTKSNAAKQQRSTAWASKSAASPSAWKSASAPSNSRSAQAIEHVGEQVARMADRFNQRQDILARELGERMIDSEERAGQRVSEAISSIMQRLAEVEEHSPRSHRAGAEGRLQRRLQARAVRKRAPARRRRPQDVIPTPSRRFEDFPSFDAS